MCYLYVLYSISFDRYYVGITDDVEKRVKGHNKGEVTSTRPYAPWKAVYVEEHDSKPEARKREKYLKSAAGRRWRKKNLSIHKGD